MSNREDRKRDFLSFLAIGAVTFFTGGLATPAAVAAFAARTALTLGMHTESRAATRAAVRRRLKKAGRVAVR